MIDFDMPASGTWEQRGGWVVRALMGEFGLTAEQAAGLVGNLGFESIGFTAHHEIGQPDGVGGYGWGQWTGPRRRSFFDWCASNNRDPRSDAANYGYLIAELHGQQAATITMLRKCKTLDASVWSVGQTYERPGGTTPTNLPGYSDRLQWARRALAGAQAEPGGATQPARDEPAMDACPADPITPEAMSAAVMNIQLGLRLSGDYDGAIDGLWGKQSAAALTAFQKRIGQ